MPRWIIRRVSQSNNASLRQRSVIPARGSSFHPRIADAIEMWRRVWMRVLAWRGAMKIFAKKVSCAMIRHARLELIAGQPALG